MKKILETIGSILLTVALVGAGYGIYRYCTKDTSTKTEIVTIDKTNETLITDVIDKGEDVDVEINPSLTDNDNLAELTTYILMANNSGYSYALETEVYECLAWGNSLSQNHFFEFSISEPGTHVGGNKFFTAKKDDAILGSIQVSTYVNKYDLNGNYISTEPIKITYGLSLEDDNIYMTWAEAHYGIQKVKTTGAGGLGKGQELYLPLQLCNGVSEVDFLFTDAGFTKANVIYKAADVNKNEIITTRYGFTKEAYICFKALYSICLENEIKPGTAEVYNVDLSKYGMDVMTSDEFDYLSANAAFGYQTKAGGYDYYKTEYLSAAGYTLSTFKISY